MQTCLEEKYNVHSNLFLLSSLCYIFEGSANRCPEQIIFQLFQRVRSLQLQWLCCLLKGTFCGPCGGEWSVWRWVALKVLPVLL